MGFGGGEVAANEGDGWLGKVAFREKGREGGGGGGGGGG